ncbi:MAG: ABC transporter permease [Anaerolineae bacterium]|nr:ABC transporter permease [Anaerolineae bacterium]
MTVSAPPLEIVHAHRRQPGVLRRLLKNLSGTAGLLLVIFYVGVGVLGALGATPFPPNEQHARDRLQPPSAVYVMGTDLFGRDLASRVIAGAAHSLRVAVTSVTLAGLAGTLLGVTAGFAGGRVDSLLMRLMDVFFAFPALLLALVIVTVLGPGTENAIIAIAIVYTPIFARVARAPVLAVKQMEFVMAARCIGGSSIRVLLRHVMPNTLAPLIVQISLALSWSLLTEAGLSFLGLGAIPPMSSWGVMLNEHRALAENAPWLILYPGMAIALAVLGFNLLGDGLRDVLDPRLRGRK